MACWVTSSVALRYTFFHFIAICLFRETQKHGGVQVREDNVAYGTNWNCVQEAAVVPPHVAFAVRPNPGFWEYVKVNADDLQVEGIDAVEYLKLKEMIFDEKW